MLILQRKTGGEGQRPLAVFGRSGLCTEYLKVSYAYISGFTSRMQETLWAMLTLSLLPLASAAWPPIERPSQSSALHKKKVKKEKNHTLTLAPGVEQEFTSKLKWAESHRPCFWQSFRIGSRTCETVQQVQEEKGGTVISPANDTSWNQNE